MALPDPVSEDVKQQLRDLLRESQETDKLTQDISSFMQRSHPPLVLPEDRRPKVMTKTTVIEPSAIEPRQRETETVPANNQAGGGGDDNFYTVTITDDGVPATLVVQTDGNPPVPL